MNAKFPLKPNKFIFLKILISNNKYRRTDIRNHAPNTSSLSSSSPFYTWTKISQIYKYVYNQLVYTKTMDSGFRALLMDTQTRDIQCYPLPQLLPASDAKQVTSKMASRFPYTVTNRKISQVNEEPVPENTKKATELGKEVLTGKALSV